MAFDPAQFAAVTPGSIPESELLARRSAAQTRSASEGVVPVPVRNPMRTQAVPPGASPAQEAAPPSRLLGDRPRRFNGPIANNLRANAGNIASDWAGGMAVQDRSTNPFGSFAAGLAGSIQARQGREQAALAASLAADQQAYDRAIERERLNLDIRAAQIGELKTAAEIEKLMEAAQSGLTASERIRIDEEVQRAHAERMKSLMEWGGEVTEEDRRASLLLAEQERAARVEFALGRGGDDAPGEAVDPAPAADAAPAAPVPGMSGAAPVMPAPTSGPGSSPLDPIPDITTEEQFQALPIGAWFIDPETGTARRKTSN